MVQLRAEDNSLVAEYIYSGYGEILSIKDASGNEITDVNHIANVNPIRYRGYYYDTETGFYYLRSRYYDPITCRFISPDKISTVSEILNDLTDKNLYSYCDNNPILRSDDDGEFWQFALAGGGVAGFSWSALGSSIVAGLGAITPVGWIAIGTVTVVAVGAAVYTEHRTLKNGSKRKSNDKHTKPRPGRSSEKKKQKDNWKRRR